MKILLSLLVLLGACKPDYKERAERYLGASAWCVEGSEHVYLCTQKVGDETFTVLCFAEEYQTLCANFPSYDPPPPAAGGTCNAR